MIIAVLMAGGKGTRLETSNEKPIFQIKGKPLIDHVLFNLHNSKYIEKIVIAVSPNTPKTKEYITNRIKNNKNNRTTNILEIKENTDSVSRSQINEIIIETPGNGYLDDLSFILDYFEKKNAMINKNTEKEEHDTLLFINSDLPFVSSEIIDYTLENYFKSKELAMSVLVPIDIFKKYGVKYSYLNNGLVPSGLNVLVSKNIIQNERKLVISSIELALNINDLDDVKLANEIFK